jgi:hypothetical protein
MTDVQPQSVSMSTAVSPVNARGLVRGVLGSDADCRAFEGVADGNQVGKRRADEDVDRLRGFSAAGCDFLGQGRGGSGHGVHFPVSGDKKSAHGSGLERRWAVGKIESGKVASLACDVNPAVGVRTSACRVCQRLNLGNIRNSLKAGLQRAELERSAA